MIDAILVEAESATTMFRQFLSFVYLKNKKANN